MAYAGYLLKAGGVEIPTSYIRLATYKVTPNQRLELSAERNTDGILVRTTASNQPSKIEFNTPYLYSSQLSALMSIITTAYTDSAARKLSLDYYVPDLDAYQVGNFYVPDISYTIYQEVSSSVLLYEETRIAFIEY